MPINSLTAVYCVSDAMLAEFGFRYGYTREIHCTDPGSILLPLAELRWPQSRALDPKRLRKLLRRIMSGTGVPAIPVYREPGAITATVLDGAHRLAIIKAMGVDEAPCVILSRDEAEVLYAYPDGQRDLP